MRPCIHSALPALCLSLLAGGCQSAERSSSEPQPSTAIRDARDEDVFERARALQDRITTLDSHAGFTGDPLRSCGETDRQVDFTKMRQGGLDAIFFIVYAEQRERTDAAYADAERQALEIFRSIHKSEAKRS